MSREEVKQEIINIINSTALAYSGVENSEEVAEAILVYLEKIEEEVREDHVVYVANDPRHSLNLPK